MLDNMANVSRSLEWHEFSNIHFVILRPVKKCYLIYPNALQS